MDCLFGCCVNDNGIVPVMDHGVNKNMHSEVKTIQYILYLVYVLIYYQHANRTNSGEVEEAGG